MSEVPNSGLLPLEQREALFRALNNAANYAPKDIASTLAEVVYQLLEERDQYGQDAYHDGKRADAAESDVIAWSYRIDAIQELHQPSPYSIFGRRYCKTCDRNGGEFPCATKRALDGEGGAL